MSSPRLYVVRSCEYNFLVKDIYTVLILMILDNGGVWNAIYDKKINI